jgi:acetolactate synthase-1/3 small subunit
MRHTLSVLVENKFGVLARVAGMFSGRGYNIDTLNVGPTSDPKVSRMTIVVRGEDATLDQVTKLLDKLVEVIDVIDFHDGEYVDRELVLIQVRVENAEVRSEVIQLCDIFRARIIDVHPQRLTLEITGEEGKINKFVSLMEPFGVIEITRTGKIALPRS